MQKLNRKLMSKNSPFSGWLYYPDAYHKEYLLTTFPDNMDNLDL